MRLFDPLISGNGLRGSGTRDIYLSSRPSAPNVCHGPRESVTPRRGYEKDKIGD
jgi:hypothetical protein